MSAKETHSDQTEASTAPRSRPIRSFTLRQGRITTAQAKALEDLWPVYGLAAEAPFAREAAFGRQAPLVLEIGFGNGESLAQMAERQPDVDFLGIEVHTPGVGHLLLALQEKGLGNVRVYRADALEILGGKIPDGSLAGLQVFFPDPWPKSRHHKRRLVNPEFLRLAAAKLAPGGYFHAATDWADYAEQMLADLEACPDLVNQAGLHAYAERPETRPETKFERRGRRLGHGVYDLLFRRP
jgi:tRNA (guanine-N7-)-methyltransferase